MARVTIPAAQVEFDDGGQVLWVTAPNGGTLLRIKLWHGRFRAAPGCENVCSHADLLVERLAGANQDVVVCVVADDVVADDVLPGE